MSASDQIAARHFGRPAVKLLAKRGIRVLGLQALPDAAGSFLHASTGYVIDDNGCGRVWTHQRVLFEARAPLGAPGSP